MTRRSAPKVPYGRLAGFYFFYFCALGAFMPYWTPYLERQGLLPIEIGWLMAIPAVTKILVPTCWSWLAGRTGYALGLIRLTSLLSCCSFAVIWWVEGVTGWALMMLLFSFFLNGILPLFETLTLNYLDQNSQRYAMVRIWGSIGFIVSVMGTGKVLEKFLAIEDLPYWIGLLFGGMWLVSLIIPCRREPIHGSDGPSSLKGIIQRSEVIAFFLACMLVQLSHGPHYVFFTLYLENLGFSKTHIGQIWALGVLAEIILFFFIHQLLNRFSLRQVFLMSLALGVVRWLLIAWGGEQLVLLLIAQILHAASFGSAHIAAIHLVHGYFRGPHHGTGQALYSSLSFGLGGALGSIGGGYYWASWGPAWIYTAAAVASALALLVAWPWVGKINRTVPCH